MKKVLIGILGFFALLIVVAIIGFSSMWSHRNVAVSMDEGIKAQHVSNKSNYDAMWKSCARCF